MKPKPLGETKGMINTEIHQVEAEKLVIERKLSNSMLQVRMILTWVAVEVAQSPVPSLAYGLERVLFK